jgi:short-subunit dehydrogenase
VSQQGGQTGQLRVALVTGGSSGIGRETALAFARRGDKVGVTARRLDRLEALADEARKASLPGEIKPYGADVTDPEAMKRVVADMDARWGRLDALVANAGVGQRGSVADAEWADIDAVLRTNIDGVLHSIRAAVPLMRRSGGGHIVTVSSVVSSLVTPYATIYAASKAYVNTLARGLRAELAPDHIWVTNMLIGQTHSEFAQSRRGRPGKISGLPTMATAYVARCIVRETTRRRRTVTLRWFDRMLIVAGMYLPWIMDRIAARMYR